MSVPLLASWLTIEGYDDDVDSLRKLLENADNVPNLKGEVWDKTTHTSPTFEHPTFKSATCHLMLP